MARPRPTPLPVLTKTARLRQTRSATMLKEYEQKQEAARRPPPPSEVRRRVRMPEAKKVEFAKPAVTKAMLARIKHAERVKQELERKREEALPRRPRRTPAPIGGDPRLGRERIPRAPRPRREEPRREPEPIQPVPERTRELARSMNAEVIQAAPVGEGPIDSIVIPPRAVSETRPTIVSIPQPPAAPPADLAVSDIANRSIQVINETLREQDVAEKSAVQTKLEDLQQARRDFVMAVAHVGGNAVQLKTNKTKIIHTVPELEGEELRIQYHREHPTVVAAREFAQRSMAALRDREEARKLEELERAAEEAEEDLGLYEDIPFAEEEFLREVDVSWEEDEDIPRPSKIRAALREIPVREEYRYPAFEPEQLERFFDIERYPPTPPRVPPPGREHLHPDLWLLDDPWYRPAPCPACADEPDLIRFD